MLSLNTQCLSTHCNIQSSKEVASQLDRYSDFTREVLDVKEIEMVSEVNTTTAHRHDMLDILLA